MKIDEPNPSGEDSIRQQLSLKGLSDWYIRRRYSVLFATLLVTFVAAPIAAEYHLRSGPIILLLTLNLGAAAFGLVRSRRRNLILAIVVITALLQFLGRSLQSHVLTGVGSVLWVALAAGTVYGALRFVLKGREIDSEHVSAALGAYLLAGLLFGIVFYEVETVRTGSFVLGGQAFHPRQFDMQSSIYFSFVTLATLGYGDITPATPTARGLAITEAIIGQLYLAVLVARLVGAAGNRKQGTGGQ